MTLHRVPEPATKIFSKRSRAGMTIVHVNTELPLAWRHGLDNALQAHPAEIAPYKLLPKVVEAVSEVVRKRLRLF